MRKARRAWEAWAAKRHLEKHPAAPADAADIRRQSEELFGSVDATDLSKEPMLLPWSNTIKPFKKVRA